MRLLVTGICGFVGSTLASALQESVGEGIAICGIDNLSRAGSETNRAKLLKRGITVFHGDARLPSDLDSLPPFDWVIDAAANPAVMAGVDGKTSSRQIVEHNLLSTINLLEICRRHKATFTLLSTSRVYSIAALSALPIVEENGAFALSPAANPPGHVSSAGLTEAFPTTPPVSLYGATKLASELLALEYGETFGFPVWINRCGLLAGAGQFGKPDQGLVSFWIHAWAQNRPLRFIGFGGGGLQVRDCMHPRDLVPLLSEQWRSPARAGARILNVSGGAANAFSLKQLSDWCARRFGARAIGSAPEPRPFDIPWLILDSGLAARSWNWAPRTNLEGLFEEIARHAAANPHWLDLSGVAAN